MITVRFTVNAKRAKTYLNTLQDNLKQGAFLREINTVVADSISLNYKAQGRPRWRDRIWSIYKDGNRYAVWTGVQWPILDHTGNKRNIEEQSARYGTWKKIGKTWRLHIMTPLYGMAHHIGAIVRNPITGRKMKLPVRKSVDLQDYEINAIREYLRAFPLKLRR